MIPKFKRRYCKLDGEEEYIVYTVPVGTIRDQDKESEQAFYKFVDDEGL